MSDCLTSRNTPLSQRAQGVLVVDDDREVRDALEWALKREGFAVWVAPGGSEALDLYRANGQGVDVVLLDVRMPRMDGPQVLTALQSLSPKIACCFMSGDLGAYTAAELRQRGARAVLIKPLRVPELADLLRGVAQEHSALCA